MFPKFPKRYLKLDLEFWESTLQNEEWNCLLFATHDTGQLGGGEPSVKSSAP